MSLRLLLAAGPRVLTTIFETPRELPSQKRGQLKVFNFGGNHVK